MLREMAKMSPKEASEWYTARADEAIRAMRAGTIDGEVSDSILRWAMESYADYLTALGEGLITPMQVAGEKGGRDERR